MSKTGHDTWWAVWQISWFVLMAIIHYAQLLAITLLLAVAFVYVNSLQDVNMPLLWLLLFLSVTLVTDWSMSKLGKIRHFQKKVRDHYDKATSA